MSKRRKSVGRRRSHSLAGFASKNLCETIPKSLSSSERLLMLIERSFQYALSVVQKELTFEENFDTSIFREQAAIYWEKIRTDLEERNLCETAATQDSPTTVSFLADDVEQYHKATGMVESEINQWKKCLASYREALQKEIDHPYEVNSLEWEALDQDFDYSDICKETSSIHEKLCKQVAILSTAESSVTRCLKLRRAENNRYLLHKKCEKNFQRKVRNSPRTLIKKMVHANKIGMDGHTY